MELTPSPGAPMGFPYEEKRARAALGLNKDEARALRRVHLNEEDFVVHKKRVYLSELALQKLAQAARVRLPGKSAVASPSSKAAPLDSVKSATAVPAEEVTLRVVRADLKNPHMIMACHPDDNVAQPLRPLRVRVKDPSNFVQAMEVPARLIPGYQDFYELTRPCPRKRGKW